MRKLTTLTAAAAMVAAFGFAGSAMAQDPEADAVAVDGINNASCGGDCTGAATDTLEAADGTIASLGTNGFVKLNFTDNFCIIAAGDDVTVTETGAAEAYDVQVATNGGTLSGKVGGVGTANVDLGAGVTT